MQPYLGLGNSLQTAQGSAGLVPAGGWVELARTTLGSDTKPITVASIPDKRYYMILIDMVKSGNATMSLRYGNSTIDTGSNYACRVSYDGAADATPTSTSTHQLATANAGVSDFLVGHIANLSSKEKLMQYHWAYNSATGTGTAPTRAEEVGKWVNTSNVIDTMQLYNSQAGDYVSGSEVVVLGWDPADTHTTNFWTELASVTESSGQLDSLAFTTKKYLWIQAWLKPASGTWNGEVRVGSTTIDTGTNYANRQSGNGGADSASTGVDKLFNSNGISSIDNFVNIFIVNKAAAEKIAIGQGVEGKTLGAGTAPDRNEMVGKWVNTSNQIDRISISKTSGTGVMDSTSILKVWGSD